MSLLSVLAARRKMTSNIAEIFSGYQGTLEAEQELREVFMPIKHQSYFMIDK